MTFGRAACVNISIRNSASVTTLAGFDVGVGVTFGRAACVNISVRNSASVTTLAGFDVGAFAQSAALIIHGSDVGLGVTFECAAIVNKGAGSMTCAYWLDRVACCARYIVIGIDARK